MLKKNHPFHMVEVSPWPFLTSLMALALTSSMIIMMHMETKALYFLTMFMIVISSFTWWLNVSQEALSQGVHMSQSMNNLKIGMMLFISSEIMFFSSFFWAFFHSSLSPSMELGAIWPPSYIRTFNPMNIPLLNTLVLLSSGISITWAHHSILSNNLNQTNISMILTILLGIYFTLLQLFEYLQAQFSIADSAYGATFFVATGFHGFHVIIGSILILISWYRINILMAHPNHIVSFETAAWYWHFVDVIWLFLYSSIYWWSTN